MDFLKLLENIRNPVLTNIFRFFTLFGEETFILCLICGIYWCLNKKLAYRLGFSFFLSGLAVQALKVTCKIPRPWVRDPSFSAVPEALATAGGYSFPSGHSQGATTLAVTLSLFFKKKKWTFVLCAIALCTCFSRMYLGVHTPLDVLIGLSLSAVITFIVNKVFDYYHDRPFPLFPTALVFLFISLCVLGYSLALYNNGTVPLSLIQHTCKAAGGGAGFAVGWYIEKKFIRFQEGGLSVLMQLIKLLIGLFGLLLLKAGSEKLFGLNLTVQILSYFLFVLYILVIYPLIFCRFHRISKV